MNKCEGCGRYILPGQTRCPPPSTLRFHKPRWYRYEVARPGLRTGPNRYPGAWIGWYMVIGRYAYCIKWGWA